MFKKKTCKKCGKEIRNSYEFCPNCGNRIKENNEFGMLGRSDSVEQQNPFESLFNGFGGKIFGKMLTSTMKMLEKEIQKEIRKEPQIKTNFRLSINGKEINLNNPQQTTPKKIEQKTAELNQFSKKEREKFQQLPQKEPLTDIKRFSDKIIYELKMPGVTSIENVSINQLEKSIEVKALAKTKAYSKLIPINLPIINYFISKGNLILELGEKNK